MEVMVIPSSPAHVSAPSTPKHFEQYYFSAPTSPSHLSQFYRDFDDLFVSNNATAEPPVDFAFNVSEDWETASLSADELFDGGVIKPLINAPAPPRLQHPPAARFSENVQSAPRGAKSPTTAAGANRGRERSVNVSKSSSRRAARSLSPLRDTQFSWAENMEQPPNTTICSALSTTAKGHKKWRLKDFFLFRSASEGRAADKDPLKKYTAAIRQSGSRMTDSPGSGSGSKRRGRVSAHEQHYTVNRAASEDLKRKTFLPYKQGLLGRLSFNPAVHALSNGFGFSRK